jgi:hypothetical protein
MSRADFLMAQVDLDVIESQGSNEQSLAMGNQKKKQSEDIGAASVTSCKSNIHNSSRISRISEESHSK